MIPNKNPTELETIRHSCAHLMAQAVQELFPGTQVTIGPVIEDGFFYDFSRKDAFVPEDLVKIEKRMKELTAADIPIVRSEISREEAKKNLVTWVRHSRSRSLNRLTPTNQLRFTRRETGVTSVVDRM